MRVLALGFNPAVKFSGIWYLYYIVAIVIAAMNLQVKRAWSLGPGTRKALGFPGSWGLESELGLRLRVWELRV